MDMTWQTVLWRQFGAAIDMLESTLLLAVRDEDEKNMGLEEIGEDLFEIFSEDLEE